MILFPPYAPDGDPYQFTDTATNVVPVSGGYGPFKKFVAVSDALDAAPLAGFQALGASGLWMQFAATQAGIYRLIPDGEWEDVSKTGWYNGYQGWCFCQFGDVVIATNGFDQPQYYDMNTSSQFADIADAPVALYCWTAGDYVVFGSVDGNTRMVQWSGLNDYSFWTIGEKGCDLQELPEGAEVLGGYGDQSGFWVFQRETAIQRFNAAPGSGFTFSRAVANPTRGIGAPGLFIPIGPQDFIALDSQGFYRGAAGQLIGAERIDRHMQEAYFNLALQSVSGGADYRAKIAWFCFPILSTATVMLGYS